VRNFIFEPPLQLEVGGVYECRNPIGWQQLNKPTTRTIIKKLPDNYIYDYEDDQGETYMRNGQFLVNQKTRFDLVRRLN